MKRSWLDVDNAKTGRADRYCLDGFPRILIGSAPFVTLLMTTGHWYSPQHASITRLGERWQLADLGSTNGLFMNGAQMKTARWLDSGDAFYVSAFEKFRFSEEPRDPRWEAQVLKLAQSEEGEGPWRVFSDALQELGDETGKRMVSSRELAAVPLGFLDRMRSDGTVSFDCDFGFIRALTVRNLGLARELEARVIDAVLAQPAACLLRVLEIDVQSFEAVALDALAAAVVRAMPPSLRVVRLLGVFGAPPLRMFPASLQVEWAPI